MTISTHSFPGCCTAKIITGLGGSSTVSHAPGQQPDEKELAAELTKHMEQQTLDGNGILVITTTSEQTVAETVLPKLGWQKCMTSHKKRHSETILTLWSYACQDASKQDVVVKNPFGKAKTAAITPDTPRVANRSLEDYINIPRGIWIRVEGSQPMDERLRGLVMSVRLVSNTSFPENSRNFTRLGHEWSWALNANSNGCITHVWIHPNT